MEKIKSNSFAPCGLAWKLIRTTTNLNEDGTDLNIVVLHSKQTAFS